MADNDEVSGEDSADTPYIPTGPRRSTYTPPTGDYPPLFGRTDSSASEERIEPTSSPAPDPEPAPAREARVDAASTPEAKPAPETDSPPAELPDPPRRRSLQDDELVRTLSIEIQEPANTLNAIEQLQAELQLREQEAQEFSAWEQRMRTIGTPEALETIAEVVPEFTGVIPIVQPEQQPEDQVAPPPPFVDPQQFPPPRAEERVEVVPEQEPNLSDHIVFVPPWVSGTGGAEMSPDGGDESGPSDEAPEPASSGAPEAQDTPAAPIVYELVDPQLAEPISEPAPTVDEAPQSETAHAVAETDAAEPDGANQIAPELATNVAAAESAEPSMDEAGEQSGGERGGERVEPPTEESTEEAAEEANGPAHDQAADPFDALLTGGSDPGPAPEDSQPLNPSIEPEPAVTPPSARPAAVEPEQTQGLFSIELSGEQATPVALRAGRAARMFWLWFATNSSAVSLAFGAGLLGLGMSLRQAILAAFIGVAISFLPLGLGTLAGKWSGQPTIVVSRATFGLVGNIVPAVLALVTRLFWGAVLLWLLAMCTARILVGASLSGPFDEAQLSYIAATVAVVLAFVIAFFGYQLFARVQLVLSIVSGVLILGLFATTWQRIDFRSALTVGDGPWILVVTGVVLVFSFVGLVWANASGDLARYQRTASSGASASLWASFGATLPAFLLIAYGALLAASSPGTARELVADPLDAVASLIPGWYLIPLLEATALSLLAGVALSLYSGGFVLRAIGMSLSRHLSVVVMGVVVFAAALLMILSGAGVAGVFRDLTTSLAVPIAAWAGIFGAEVMIRRRGFHEESLLRPGGIYPSVNWINLVMLVVASVIGFGFTTAHITWLSWQGYGFVLFGFPLEGEVAASDLGVIIALVLGLLTPLAAGISTVRQQELARG